jgi:hypothetical protein
MASFCFIFKVHKVYANFDKTWNFVVKYTKNDVNGLDATACLLLS